MKKLITLILCVLFLVSCSKDDDGIQSNTSEESNTSALISLIGNWKAIEQRELVLSSDIDNWGNWFPVYSWSKLIILNETDCRTESSISNLTGTYIYDELNQKITLNIPEADFPTRVCNIISLNETNLILQSAYLDSYFQVKYVKE
jgi:hypothetical protein